MVRGTVFWRGLATVLLSGPWSQEAMVQRAKAGLRTSPKARWISPLVRRILVQFGVDGLPPTQRRLVEFLRSDAGLRRKLVELDGEPTIDTLAVPAAQMIVVPGPSAGWSVPDWPTSAALGAWLTVDPTQLDWLADRRGRERFHESEKLRHYRYRWIGKGQGRYRLVEAPKFRLKTIQRTILRDVLEEIPTHEAAHAFRRGRSVLTYVGPHVGCETVLHLDLRNFFPSIGRPRIRALFRWAGYPEPVADILAGLCTNSVSRTIVDQLAERIGLDRCERLARIYSKPHLPQGAPTSPMLANLAAYRLDCRLDGLARKIGVNYTRYADDLVFSGDRTFRRRLAGFRRLVCAIAIDEGFDIQHRKTRVMTAGTRQEVAGVVLNVHPNIRREEYDRLRATLFNCVRNGPANENREARAHFQEHLAGRIAYVAMLNPRRGEKLSRLFERIEW